MATIQEAVNVAKGEFLGRRGVTGVSYIGNIIVIYIEDTTYANIVPSSYMGYAVTYKVTGGIHI